MSERDWQQGDLPHMMILAEDGEAQFLAGKPRYKPLYPVDEGGRRAAADVQGAPGRDESRRRWMRNGQIIGLPVGLATPIMYYNRDAFKKAGLDPSQPPKTWWDLQQALGKLYDAGTACPYTTSLSGMGACRKHQRLAQRAGGGDQRQARRTAADQQHAHGQAPGHDDELAQEPLSAHLRPARRRRRRSSPSANARCSPHLPPAFRR
ncbi:MAG: extracellular solute-binding protein [Comamonadaceae bacterium]|nr:extracellular solute-binding protein [Comamonadaceae bacterium]